MIRTQLEDFLSMTQIRRVDLLVLVGCAVISGVLNVALIALVTEALRDASPAGLVGKLWQFLTGAAVYLVVLGFLQSRVVIMTEMAASAIKSRFAQALFESSLIHSEVVPFHLKQAVFGRDAAIVTSAVPGVVTVIASLASVVFGLGYLFVLSFKAAFVVCAVILLAVYLYQSSLNRLMARLRAAFGLNDQFFRFGEDLMHGAKELKLDRRWATQFINHDLMTSLDKASHAMASVRVKQQYIGLVSAVAFFLLIAITVFLSRLYGDFDGTLATSFLLTLMFLNLPIQNAVGRMPMLGEAVVALQRIKEVMSRLKREAMKPLAGSEQPVLAAWKNIHLRGVDFEYPSEDGTRRFGLQDIDITVERGDLVFITGGNGSGKTTLAKIILGLYKPTRGGIWLDDTSVASEVQSYRHQFNAVFSDAHLFGRNVDSFSPEFRIRFDALVRELDLETGVRPDGQLELQAMSQGQRKRMALIVALAEDKPIQFFDEWTADQDPEFRRYFYDTFLPRLHAEGKTVFVISHDDRYFHCADLLIKMDEGRATDVSRRHGGTVLAAGAR